MRKVAAEAGLSMGSVRHFFGSQGELHASAMRAVQDGVFARIERGAARRERLVADGEALGAALDLLGTVLPLDAERRREARIWLTFSVNGLVDPGLAGARREADRRVRNLCRSCSRELVELGRVPPDVDEDAETQRLWTVLEGITLQVLMGDLSARKAEDVLLPRR